ncbi:hypothetical protein QYE76_048052 [Lolium multiflorum]|uniref:DDE Tnp4 domain-containing protein n=1 Tax=Lolium multiflorum TaxID=4521 RepID=A0AAD8TPX5_LOLMU|nr:hypothetical protein QYE76_048052 [Lolium multiflorum]
MTDAAPSLATATSRLSTLDNAASHQVEHRGNPALCSSGLTVGFHREAKLMGRGAYTRMSSSHSSESEDGIESALMDARRRRRRLNTAIMYQVLSHSEKHLEKKPRVEPSPQSVTQVQNRFKRSRETINRKFAEVLYCVNQLAGDIIKPIDPQFPIVHERLRDSRFTPHFDGAIGAIDGTHIPVTVPAAHMVNHVGRYGYSTQNVMAVCDFDLRFTSIVAGWPGRYYLVDSGYPNQDGYLSPYTGTKYHLPEFRLAGPPTGKNEIFNHAHSSLRNAIERTFGVLKQKWRILRGVPSYPLEKQTEIIIASMGLHNFIRDSQLFDLHFYRCDNDENYMPPGHVVSTSGGNVGNDLGDDHVSMNNMRDNIADDLFIARGGVL